MLLRVSSFMKTYTIMQPTPVTYTNMPKENSKHGKLYEIHIKIESLNTEDRLKTVR